MQGLDKVRKNEKVISSKIKNIKEELKQKIRDEGKIIKEINKKEEKLEKYKKKINKQEKKDVKKLAQLQSWLKWFWWFIWEDDSIWSWIANIIVAFILIKFIVYPGLGLVFNTGYPVVAVVSSSMEHDGNFDQWWNSGAMCIKGPCLQREWYSEKNISFEKFKSFSLENGFNKGDIMVLFGYKPENIKIGDVIVFRSVTSDPIIHRVVKKYNENGIIYFQTKGDHNYGIHGGILEEKISQDRLIGKAVLRVPFLGYVKIWFVEIMKFIGLMG